MHCLKTIVWLVVAAIIIGLGVLYSGIVNVSAGYPHSAITRWLLHTGMKESVRYHARGIKPPSLDDPRMVLAGFRHYREMCVRCHLAPGIKSSEIRQGLMPKPPKLQQAVKHLTPAEIFWIVKHGVRMTAMPAWGKTHSDDKIWAIVAFLQKLPHMTAAQYQQMAKAAGPADGNDNHAAASAASEE